MKDLHILVKLSLATAYVLSVLIPAYFLLSLVYRDFVRLFLSGS